jgi:hypothetical protein
MCCRDKRTGLLEVHAVGELRPKGGDADNPLAMSASSSLQYAHVVGLFHSTSRLVSITSTVIRLHGFGNNDAFHPRASP